MHVFFSLLHIRVRSRQYSAWILGVFALVLLLSGVGHRCVSSEPPAPHAPWGMASVEASHGEHAAPQHTCPACTWQSEAANGLWTPLEVRIIAVPQPEPIPAVSPAPRAIHTAPYSGRGPPSA